VLRLSWKCAKYVDLSHSLVPSSAHRSGGSVLTELLRSFLFPGFGPQNQPGVQANLGSIFSFRAHRSHHSTFQLRAVPRKFRSHDDSECLATLHLLGAIVTGKRPQLAVTITAGATVLKVEEQKNSASRASRIFLTCSEIHLQTCKF